MKKGILEVYALAVCFFTVACLVIYTGIALYNVVRVSAPEFTLNPYQYERHQTNDAFKETLCKQDCATLSDDAVTAKREESYRLAVRGERRNSVQALVQNSITIAVALIVLLAHWRLAGRARASSVGAQPTVQADGPAA